MMAYLLLLLLSFHVLLSIAIFRKNHISDFLSIVVASVVCACMTFSVVWGDDEVISNISIYHFWGALFIKIYSVVSSETASSPSAPVFCLVVFCCVQSVSSTSLIGALGCSSLSLCGEAHTKNTVCIDCNSD